MLPNHYIKPFLFILICLFITNCEKATDPEEEEEIEEMFEGHEGKYPGGWTSTTESTSFTDYPVSGIFRYANPDQTRMSGEFFATGNFKSCCDKEDDGKMTFDIEDDSIKNFYFDDKIVDCTGVFRGSGKIAANGDLVIDFTGNDCDGNHVGTLTFYKR